MQQSSHPASRIPEQAAVQADSVIAALERYRLVPVIVLESPEHAPPLADALVAGGLPIAEVTFRSDAAEAAIQLMAERGDLLVGAGTVLTVEQADRATQAGARFAIAPGFNPAVVRHCQQIGLPIIPGVSNPTDIETALTQGVNTVKFFPAEACGGVAMLKAMSGPYPMMRFVPTGGIKAANLCDYLANRNVLACGGSWMVSSDLIAKGDFEAVEHLVREAVALARRGSELMDA